jgi:hypothetical protein
MAIDILSYPLNETNYLAEDAQLFTCTRTSGVYSSNEDYKVTAMTDRPMEILVSSGIAWIRYERFAGIVAANKSDITLKLDTADSTLNRIDRVVIRFNRIFNKVEVDVKKGMPAASPKAPTIQRDANAYELGIAEVFVGAGKAVLKASDISDTKLDSNLCGVMSDGVTGIPTQSLFDNWIDWFNELKITSQEEFANWLNALGAQAETSIGEKIFAFAIEGNDLVLYYSTGTNPDNYKIEDGCLMYEFEG